MRKISKKLLAVLMAAVMVMGIAPVSGVFAYTDSVETQSVAETPMPADSSDSEELMTASASEESENLAKYTIGVDETLTVEVLASEITYIEFTPEADGVYVFTSNSSSDTYGYLYDENYNQITYNDDGGSNSNFLITKSFDAGKTYYYGVRFYSSSTSGAMEVKLTSLTNDIEVLEFGETLTTEIVSGQSSYLKFVPETDGIYVFETYVDRYAYIYLYNENLSSIASKYNSYEGNTLQLARYLNAGNTYYFRAESYSVSESIDAIIYNPEETIEVGETVTADIKSGYSPYIKFVPENKGLYAFTVPSESDVKVYLYNEGLYSLAYEFGKEEDGSLQIGAMLAAGEIYYFYAENYSNHDSIEITLTEVEDVVAKTGETVTVDFVSEYTPYVKFVPETDGLYTVKSDCDKYVYRYLYNSNFNFLSGYSCNGEYQFAKILTAGETYYFQAQDDYDYNPESIDVTFIKSGNTVISVGDTLTEDISSGSTDYIKFIPETDGTYIFTVPSEYGTNAYLYDGNLNSVTNNYSYTEGATLCIAEHLYAGKTYYFRADRYSTAASVPITLTRADDVVIENGDTLDIDIYSGKSVYISFVPEVGGEYSFTSLTESDADAALYDKNMNRITSDYDGGTGDNFQIKSFLVAGETYYFRVYNCTDADSIKVSLTKEEDVFLEVDETLTADVSSGYSPYITVIPEKSGEYTFTMDSQNSLYVYLYNEQLGTIAYNYYNANENGVQFKQFLVGGKTYYFRVEHYESLESMDITLAVQEALVAELSKPVTADFDSNYTPYIEFIPEKDGKYIFTSEVDDYTRFYLYNEDLSQISYNYGYSGSSVSAFLCEDESYFFRAYSNYLDSGSLTLTVTEAENIKTYDIEAGETLTVELESEGETYVKFVPEADKTYAFRSYSDSDTYCVLYNANSRWLTGDNDGGYNSNFKVTYNFSAGETYYFCISLSNYRGNPKEIEFDVKLTEICNHTATNGTDLCDICGDFVFDYYTSTGYDDEGNAYIYSVISDCDALLEGSVVVPETIGGYPVERIDSSAFSDNSKITEIVIPRTLKTFNRLNVSSLVNIVIDSQNEYFTSVDGVIYSKDMKTLVLYPANREETTYSIPESVETIAAQAFYNCDKLESIVIPANVKEIGSNAFYDCDSLTGIVIPGSVKEIGLYAFESCYNLASVTISEGVEIIGSYAFRYCNSLTEIVIPGSVKEIDSYAFYDCDNLASVTISEGVESIGYDAFCDCDSLTGIVIPGSVKEIGSYAFAYCNNLASVTISEGVESIGYDAFYDCDSLTGIVIPGSVKEIGSYAFYDCDKLASVTISEGVEIIGSYAFYDCDSLTGIVIPGSVKKIGSYAFYNSDKLASVTISEGVEIIESRAFRNCDSLTGIVIPGSVKEIGSSAFYDCDKLTSVTLSEGLETIDYDAFYSCDSLTGIVIPASVEYINSSAFSYCSKLDDITILGNKTKLSSNAFYNTAHYNDSDNWAEENDFRFYYIDGYLISFEYNGDYENPTDIVIREGTKVIVAGLFRYASYISKVTLPEGLEYIGDEAFYDSSITEINLPSGVELGERVFSYCNNLEKIEIGNGVKGLGASGIDSTPFVDNKENYENGVLYLGDTLYKADSASVSGEYVVKEGTKSIGDGAFENCTMLTGISIPSSVEDIGKDAFTFCVGIESITLPEGITAINDGTFSGCLALKSIDIPSTVTEIGSGAFALNTSLESITLPEAVTVIPDSAFMGCINLKSAPINADTTAIGEAAFAGCISLTEINIGASVEEIGMTSFVGCSSVEKYTVDEANPIYEAGSDGVLYGVMEENDIRRRALISYPSASPATSFSIPEDVIYMGVPFVSCANLETIDVPAGFAVDPEDGEFYYGLALELLAISSATMKIDINSLVELIGKYKDNIVDIAHAIYDIVIDISDSDEDEMINTINNVINGVCNYIMSISSVDEVYSKVTGLLTGVVEAASLTTFKGFNVSEDHPGLYDDDGILYVKGDFYDDDEEEKYLIACPATKTGKVRIDDGTTDVLMGAFALCNLDEVVIPSTVTKLQPITFALSNIGEMVIPESVEEIGEAAFTAANISTLKLENRTFFENGDYRNSSFVALFADEIVLPDDLETIPTQVFAGCLTKSYKLPSDLVNIGNAAFLANILLESIDIPAKTEYIGSGAFLGCIKLEEVDFKSQFIFGNKLKTIGDTAFTLTSVKEFNLPENLENIGVLALNPSVNGAIQYLNALIRPMLEELLEDSGEEGNHIDIDKFDINKVNETLEHVASWFTNNAGVTVDSGNRNFKAVDGDLYSYDKTRLIKVAETKSGLYEIPSSVMTVSGGAFAFTAVEDVYIPDSVNTLENGAFAYSLVSEITIGGGIREIPSGVFMGCPLLDRVTILPTVVSIDEDAFDGCPKDFAIVGYAYSYAHEYAIEHEINFETIDGKGYITIKAPSEVASAFVPVYGNTLKNTDVEIYIDGTKVGDTVSEENGYWRATVEIPEPINNKIYSITAKIDAGTEKEIESSVVFVTYSTTVPAFESITCYHGSQRRTITMDTIDIVPDYMSFNSYNPFTYEIKLSAYDSTKTLYVVSGGYRIPAVYDAKTDTYIATGYFGRAGGSHVPEYVTLELGGCTLANTSFRFPFIIDPSGFIYEAVHSNRVEGAVVSIFFRDENGLAQLWEDAFIYGQESSIITGSEGLFSWDVPNGFWQVKAEKEDYETGLSDWLPVPPEQLEVYVGLITKLSPNVKYVNGYSDGIDITFDQYMDMTTVNSENIVVTDESDDIVEGSWSPVNPEVSGTDSSVYYATTFTFTPETTLEGSYIVNVNNVENYADKAISVPYVGTVTVKQRVETLSAPESLGLIYGHDYTDSTDNVIVLDGGSGAAGLTVNVALGDDFYVESVTTVTFDEEGKAAITINPTRPGVTTVSFNLDGTNLVEKTQIVVSMPEETRVTGITLSKESVELQVDAEKQITANVAPEFATNRTVIWSSSDSSVATVDENGIVKAVKVGKATVTATTVDGGFTASCEVNVVAPASYTVTWIIDGVEHKQTLSEGDKIVVPEATEKEGYIFKGWSAEIPSVMPAENLTFTAIYEKIEAPAVKVTGVTISDSSAEIFVGAGKQLSANVVPADATNKSVTWSSSDRSVATVDGNGLVKGVKAGQATITVTTADGGFTAECTVTVEVETHKVTWIIDGVETTQTVAVGEKLTAPEVTEKEGYTFTGWTPEVPSKMPAEDVTFTAMFTANKYNAVFNANGGAWSDGSSEKPVPTEYGTEIEAPEAPARDGYLFAGWTPDVGIMDDVNGKTFNAVWISETETFYTVETYTMNTVGEYEKSSKVIVADAGESVTAEYTVPTGFSYNANKSVDRGTVAEDNSLVLKIYLDRNTYKFTTVVDGVSTSASYLYGAMVSEPVTPVKDGYKFVKWDKAVPETMPAEDVTITAEFERFYICPDCGKEFIGEDAINKHIAEEEKSKIKATIEIKNNPGSKTIKYGETLELTAVVTDMPADAIIVWYLDGEQKGEGEKFGVYFEGGTKTVEVKLVDASGNVLEDADGNEISDSEEVTVKAGFWQKLVSFFKNLFRMNRTIVQSIFKGVF